MQYGVQTHFGAPIDSDTLDQLRVLRYTMARLDCQTCDQATLEAMLVQTGAAGLRPLPIVDFPQIPWLPVGSWAEFRNEPDGDILPPLYRTDLDAACLMAQSRGVALWAPAISNLDWDSLAWLEWVRAAGGGWPVGLAGISVHRYGDGTFEDPHDGFTSRADEVDRLREICAGLPFIVTEFGYPSSGGISEDEQATRIGQEWAFWLEQGAAAAVVYQLNDGAAADEQYGIRRVDRTWKPAAFMVPAQGDDMAEFKATPMISRADFLPVAGQPGVFTCRFPRGAETILSVQADGSWQTRPPGTATAWEKFRVEGNRAVFFETVDVYYGIPVCD